jgi:hypothetical protein
MREHDQKGGERGEGAQFDQNALGRQGVPLHPGGDQREQRDGADQRRRARAGADGGDRRGDDEQVGEVDVRRQEGVGHGNGHDHHEGTDQPQWMRRHPPAGP